MKTSGTSPWPCWMSVMVVGCGAVPSRPSRRRGTRSLQAIESFVMIGLDRARGVHYLTDPKAEGPTLRELAARGRPRASGMRAVRTPSVTHGPNHRKRS
jgi:hypothetical protein